MEAGGEGGGGYGGGGAGNLKKSGSLLSMTSQVYIAQNYGSITSYSIQLPFSHRSMSNCTSSILPSNLDLITFIAREATPPPPPLSFFASYGRFSASLTSICGLVEIERREGGWG